MGVKEEYTKKDYRLKLIGTGITLLGFFVIILQMCEFRTQNESLQEQSELLNRSLLQTYRPIGWVSNINPESPLETYESFKVEWFSKNIPPKDSISIWYKPYLINEGSGVLVYLGHLYYVTDEEYSFRERIQKELIDVNQIRFDWNYSRSRQQSILPKHHRIINMKALDLDKKPYYYLYSLTLYEDQDGNLYDTENLLYFETEFNKETNKINISKTYTHDVYSAYSDEEKSILINLIKKRGHPMVKYFSENTQAEQKVVKP